MISFIVPAHNEEALIGRTLSALHESARTLGETYEIIVANDASTDRTAAIALERGAHVVDVNRRQIAATRNAGARAAMGEMFVFVDADTAVTARVLRAALRAEEVAFSQRLKRQGRFVIVRDRVTTSGRKLRAHSALDLLRVGMRLVLGGPQSLRRREGLEFWYGPRRALQ